MKKLDRFIVKSFAAPFAATLVVVVFILLLQFIWVHIDDLVGKGLGLGIIAEFLMWGVCTILPLALPLATLLSSVMVIGQMAENKELLATKASGIPFSRIIFPLIVSSLAISVSAFFVGDRLVPKAYAEIYTLRDDILKTKNEIKIPSGVFYDGIEGYTIRVVEQDKRTNMLYGVTVYDHGGNKGNTSVTFADSAIIKMAKSKEYLTFTLYNGSNYQETNEVRYADTTLALQHIDFSRQDLVVPLKNYRFEKSDSVRFEDQARAMSVRQLKHQSDSLHHRLDSLGEVHYASLRQSVTFQLNRQLDTAFRDENREWFADSSQYRWASFNDEALAMRRAADNASRFSSEISTYKYNVFEEQFYIRHDDIELLKKFAQALACLILFFIGAPLGALVRKGGLGTGVIVAAMFFVLYWVVDISGVKLATNGAISAVRGAFISSAVLLPAGALLTWCAIKDKDIFNMDQFKTSWRMVKSKISRFFRPVRIVYMGTPEFAVEPLDRLVKRGYKVVGVVTVADKPSGRGLKVNESAVKQYAVKNGIPVLQPVRLKDPEFLEALKAWKADMFVVVAFRMLPEEVWSMPRLGTFNLHAALLPQYRGAAPINWAVINGERMTGVTTFMIDKDIDTGGIIYRQECRIDPEDTAGDVHDKLMEIGAELVVQTVEGLIQNNVETRVQRSFIQGSEVLKPAPKLTRELCRIDWTRSSRDVHNLIRGLSPYPAAFTELVDGDGGCHPLKIYRSERLDMKGAPGEILTDGRTYLAIAAADGAVGLKEIQLAGKKRMDIKAFLLGFRDIDKYKVKSC